ncbi:MAG: UvrD-helicase domain-containing protein [Gammaproteobacteria bacterium]|nr:UvrD-helicase domain-containing protein [Gammaproteobacteria bacterium]
MNTLIDLKQRKQALNIDQSFIVQAPAGSGKTELLVQRSIKCLLNVDMPIQVLILTFTKKAAKEINERLKSYIIELDKRSERQSETQRLLLLLDKHIRLKKWDIQSDTTFDICKTFDSFTYQLADLSINLVTHTELLYEKIIDNIFHGDDYELIRNDLHPVLTYINYDYEKLQNLLIDLIKKRDQWLSPLLDVRQTPQQIYNDFYQFLIDMIIDYYNHNHEFSDLIHLAGDVLGINRASLINWSLNDWQILIEAFITKKGTWRKRYTNNLINKELKSSINELLSVQKSRIAELIFYLNGLSNQMPKKNILILGYLQSLLPKVCAILDVNMQALKQCDFTYLTVKAIEQLRSDQLSQSNQYAMQIKHLLIDEFQDTSHLQAVLIESLIMLWEAENQHSLFIVGDPMQSIYKFRQADVRLFKKVQSKGIGFIKPIALSLSSNFRSSSTLIDHFNNTFKYIFPDKDDLPLGGIAYHPSTAVHERKGKIYWWDDNEINSILNYVQQVPESETVAILARSRSHLLPIYQGLPSTVNTPGLFFLYEYAWIQEIAAITIAIYQPDDIARLGIQRLFILKKSWANIINHDISEVESMLHKQIEYAQKNIDLIYASQLLMPILESFLPNHYHHPISQFFLNQIDIMQNESVCINRKNIHFLLTNIRPDVSQVEPSNIQLMTIHQSKGLEFDHVIIPSIHSRSMHDPDQLIHWFQYDTQKPMMIGNIQDKSDHIDMINNVLRSLNQKSNFYEMQRLLYVAATRAKTNLIYVGKSDKNNLSFAKFLKQANIEPIKPTTNKNPICFQSEYNVSPLIDVVRPINAIPKKTFAIQSNNENSSFGSAIHHILETFISLNITLKNALTNHSLLKLCNHYNNYFTSTAFTKLFIKLSDSDLATWLFEQCEQQWCELTLNGPNQTIIRIDYMFIKNNKLYLIDFKTNTKDFSNFVDQLSIYEDAAANFLNKNLEQTLIYNPLEDVIYDKCGKRVHLEMIM